MLNFVLTQRGLEPINTNKDKFFVRFDINLSEVRNKEMILVNLLSTHTVLY